MQIALIGLGRMGSNMARRMLRGGHECIVYDVAPDAVASLVADGARGTSSLSVLAAETRARRVVWLMLPAALVGQTIDEIAPLLAHGDVLVDGGNSYYRDDITRARALDQRGISYLDVGTSGGVWGAERGYCLMIGGAREPVEWLDPIFQALAPGRDAAPATPRRGARPSTADRGYLHCGGPGAGHFVKMVHNGIEYGMMAAFAEGLNILHHADVGRSAVHADAETAPLRDPDSLAYQLDLADVTEVWRRGSVISSWLLDLAADALAGDGSLEHFDGHVADSGEGRWTLEAAIEEGVPAPVLAVALAQRFGSRGRDAFANKVLSAMRLGFGGHRERGS